MDKKNTILELSKIQKKFYRIFNIKQRWYSKKELKEYRTYNELYQELRKHKTHMEAIQCIKEDYIKLYPYTQDVRYSFMSWILRTLLSEVAPTVDVKHSSLDTIMLECIKHLDDLYTPIRIFFNEDIEYAPGYEENL